MIFRAKHDYIVKYLISYRVVRKIINKEQSLLVYFTNKSMYKSNYVDYKTTYINYNLYNQTFSICFPSTLTDFHFILNLFVIFIWFFLLLLISSLSFFLFKLLSYTLIIIHHPHWQYVALNNGNNNYILYNYCPPHTLV